ncbi:MAG: sigma-70 family RNA polymerase sigma factor [Pseudohongiellaceae bacterium]|nr:sigma-70 family RNA polymerase sigma factor [Pseudohongiellaceae bacterium]
MVDENELMRAIADGDNTAYCNAVRQHIKPISHYAFRMLGNSKDTEDITQETFLRLWTHADKWNPEKASLTTWLHRIAHNLCIDYLRKDKSSQSDDIDDADWQDISTTDNSDEQERVKDLNRAIAALPERQRSALLLCQYQGFSNKQTAQILDISVDALESILARARRSLKQQLIDHAQSKPKTTKTKQRVQEQS